LVQAQIGLGEILSDYAHHADGGKEAGGDCRVTCGTAQQPGVFGFGSFDGIQRGGTDDENAHGDAGFE
jgi:hypothetical protein